MRVSGLVNSAAIWGDNRYSDVKCSGKCSVKCSLVMCSTMQLSYVMCCAADSQHLSGVSRYCPGEHLPLQAGPLRQTLEEGREGREGRKGRKMREGREGRAMREGSKKRERAGRAGMWEGKDCRRTVRVGKEDVVGI